LLISLVGNAYLIYETGNLRRKFRNMLSAIRTTKITPQGTWKRSYWLIYSNLCCS